MRCRLYSTVLYTTVLLRLYNLLTYCTLRSHAMGRCTLRSHAIDCTCDRLGNATTCHGPNSTLPSDQSHAIVPPLRYYAIGRTVVFDRPYYTVRSVQSHAMAVLYTVPIAWDRSYRTARSFGSHAIGPIVVCHLARVFAIACCPVLYNPVLYAPCTASCDLKPSCTIAQVLYGAGLTGDADSAAVTLWSAGHVVRHLERTLHYYWR